MRERKHLIYIPSTLKDIQEHMTPAEFVSTMQSIRKYVQDRMQRVASNIRIEVVYDTMNYTDGKEIHLNPYSAAEYTRSNFDALLMLLGNALHETLHIVHTDFEACHRYHIGYINGKKSCTAAENTSFTGNFSPMSWGLRRGILGKKRISRHTEKKSRIRRCGLLPEPRRSRHHGGKRRKTHRYPLQRSDRIRPAGYRSRIPPEMPEIETMFQECQPYLKAARIAQKTTDRCRVADDIFQIIRPVIDACMDAGEKCPVFRPVQPSTHNRFNRQKQNFDSFRKVILDQYDIRKDMDRLTEAAAKDEYDRKIDRRYSDQLVMSIANLQDDGLGPLHNTIEIEYIQSDLAKFATYREAYTRRVMRLTPKIKLLLKGLLAVVQREQDDTVRNLYAGNQYREPFRADRKCCAYRKAISDEADLFIYVLVDASGSMGVVSEYVKDALTMFYEVCKKMDVPITIVAHTANGNVVSIRTLVDANMKRRQHRHRRL